MNECSREHIAPLWLSASECVCACACVYVHAINQWLIRGCWKGRQHVLGVKGFLDGGGACGQAGEGGQA